jgi:hypothetical protein
MMREGQTKKEREPDKEKHTDGKEKRQTKGT